MNRRLKSVVSVLLAIVLFATSLPVSGIIASAAEVLSSNVTYKKDGTAVVELIAGDFYNAVRYTTDGSVPTKDSKYYVMPIEIKEKTLIRAAEFDGDKKVKGIKLTVDPANAPEKSDDKTADTTPAPAPAPTEKTGKITFEVTQLGDYKAVIELECETEGAEIRYTTDGSKPDEDSELYEDGIIITEKTKIRARAYKEGYKTATTYAKTVNVKLKADAPADEPAKETVAMGTADEDEPAEEGNDKDKDEDDEDKSEETESVPAEKVIDNQKISYKTTYMDNGKTRITLTPAKSSYTIRYTTDGSVPNKNSKKYKSRLSFDEPTVLRVRQYNKNGDCVGSIKLNVKIKCADVIFNCLSMDTGIREIEMTTATPGATIYYTTNGSSPKGDNARVYTGPVFTSDIADVMACAKKEGYRDGSVTWEIAGNVRMGLSNFDFSDHQYALGLDVINTYRRSSGLSELRLDEGLTKAASLRAIEISINYSHTRPSGRNYTSTFGEFGVESVFSAEYIERHHDNAREFIYDVMAVKENADRILTSAYPYTKIGIGYYKANNTTYWVLLMITE